MGDEAHPNRMRPDEVKYLKFRNVEIVTDDYSGEAILEIKVRGKRGAATVNPCPARCALSERKVSVKREP